MTILAGQSIKGYELLERIGAGGFGAVYRAYQSTLGREVAVKVILLQSVSEGMTYYTDMKRFDYGEQMHRAHMDRIPFPVNCWTNLVCSNETSPNAVNARILRFSPLQYNMLNMFLSEQITDRQTCLSCTNNNNIHYDTSSSKSDPWKILS